MTRSWVGRTVRTVSIVGVWLALPITTTAHRLDEYLQATRVAISHDRVDLEIDLTPGALIAQRVFGGIDLDHDGQISPAEGDAYAADVLRSATLDVDNRRQTLVLGDRRFPSLREMSLGVGTIRLTATTHVPPAAAGRHTIAYQNAYRPEISVYLANALVPASTDIQIEGQRRDVRQHELRIDYRIGRAPSPAQTPARFIASAGIASLLTMVAWRQRRRLGRT